MKQSLGLLSLELHFPFAQSLKDKRAIVKSLIARTRSRFNVSVVEAGHQEVWQRARLVIAVVSGNTLEVEKTFAAVTNFVEDSLPDGMILDATEELF